MNYRLKPIGWTLSLIALSLAFCLEAAAYSAEIGVVPVEAGAIGAGPIGAGPVEIARAEPAPAQADAAVEAEPEAEPTPAPEPQLEIDRFARLCRQTLPDVAAMVGLPAGDTVAVEMMSRAEVADFVKRTVDIEYPEDELVKRSRCLWEIGLVPDGYDLEQGFVDLIAEQAGAFYDPHTKSLRGLSDLPPALRNAATEKLIVSHELCHALQDRVIDIAAQSKACLADLDREYAVRAAIEGMATVVMLAYSQGLSIDQVQDARAVMRVGFAQNQRNPSMRALATAPEYLRESLLSPYADGAAFAQAWLGANPGSRLGAMLERMPATSEQVLHFERYLEGDGPTPVDLSGVDAALPDEWVPFHTNTLGEFDLRLLLEGFEETKASAAEAAAGWDGLWYKAYGDAGGGIVLAACSVWDTESDAREFSDHLLKVLASHRPDRSGVLCEGRTVGFVVGPRDQSLRQGILAALVRANPHAGDLDRSSP